MIKGLVLPSSGGEIDAVTWLAHRPPRPARQKAASQIVLFISPPDIRSALMRAYEAFPSGIYQP
jgi:hypothetical protein